MQPFYKLQKSASHAFYVQKAWSTNSSITVCDAELKKVMPTEALIRAASTHKMDKPKLSSYQKMLQGRRIKFLYASFMRDIRGTDLIQHNLQREFLGHGKKFSSPLRPLQMAPRIRNTFQISL